LYDELFSLTQPSPSESTVWPAAGWRASNFVDRNLFGANDPMTLHDTNAGFTPGNEKAETHRKSPIRSRSRDQLSTSCPSGISVQYHHERISRFHLQLKVRAFPIEKKPALSDEPCAAFTAGWRNPKLVTA